MRCPKCHYISFGSASRCRNCGYEFSLSQDSPALELPIQLGDEPIGPMRDLPLGRRPAPSLDDSAVQAAGPLSDTPEPTRPPAAARIDLPLFSGALTHDDAPLVTPPAVPRAPLSVRRGTLTGPRNDPRHAAVPEAPEFDLQDSPSDALEGFFSDEPPPEARGEPAGSAASVKDAVAAPVARRWPRAIAAAIDLLIAGGIDAAVVYFTLQLCGLTSAEIGMLPKAPLIAFLLLLNGGYFVLFTAAGGQTIGKMAVGIRVVMQPQDGSPGRVTFHAALMRAIFYFLALLPAGIGLLPVLFSAEGRGLHDRFADTRVVKA